MAEADRIPDRIDTTPRFTADDAARLERAYAGTDTAEMLAGLLGGKEAGNVAVVSSFGAESAVLLHLVASVDPSIPVLFLETGKHFPETLAYRDLLTERLGLTDVRNLTPEPSLLTEKDESGLRWSYDPDGCCDIRKVLPLAAELAGFDASITGRKAFQAESRKTLKRFELDTSDAIGRLKINPLADWPPERIAAYMEEHDLPPHPLVEKGYPSIGCSPCTSQVAEGEDARAGRWRGWDKVECGIHTPDIGGDDLPPGYDPVF